MSRKLDSPLNDENGTWHAPHDPASAPQPLDKPSINETIPFGGQTTPAPIQSTETQGRADALSDEAPPHERDVTGEWDSLPPPIFEKGQVVFGKYRLLEKIGAGGMGEVWRVWHIDLDTERALKLIKAEIAQNDKGWIRFKREAQLMAKIDHPSAVAVFDFKRTHSIAYIEMEFIRGRSLQEILKQKYGQPMPLEWTAKVLDQLCGLLQVAHGHIDEKTGKPAPIIHRDLKPSNLMLVERPNRPDEFRLKVLDFGIAKMIEEDGGQELTGPADLVGTPAYMSPEQIKSGLDRSDQMQTVDGRSDLYATGVVLYHLLTGTLPFRGNKMALLAAHLETAPLPMKEANPSALVPAAVEAVVIQCLEKDPAERPQTARALAESFWKATGGTPPGAPRAAASIIPWPQVAAVAAGGLLLCGLATVALMTGALRGSRTTTGSVRGHDRTTRAHDGTLADKPVPPPKPKLWEPAGYEAVDPFDTVADAPSLPNQLRRKADSVLFVHLKDGLYLPSDYLPDWSDPDDLVGKWPRVIVRRSDQVRFIRIAGGSYLRGDPRRGTPDLDAEGNRCTPHYVRLGGFYIQETEVTNGEIERYLKLAHPEDETHYELWKRALDLLTTGGGAISPIPGEQARLYPAVCVEYLMARRYATWAGGALPTEAEWEFVAKSCNGENWFPWGKGFSDPRAAPRARFYSDDAVLVPAAVKSFGKETEDRTAQGIYDMAGNVRELCVDEYRPYGAIAPGKHQTPSRALVDDRTRDEPKQADPGSFKVAVRGGSFQTREAKSMAFRRGLVTSNDVPADVGFRLVIECPEANGQQVDGATGPHETNPRGESSP
jgi:eukaryotic-like serine/threonine-protein kinase